MDNISKNKGIILIKQEKGRGVVVLDRKHYLEKCLNISELGQLRNWKKIQQKR